MSFIVERPTHGPHFQSGELVGWEDKVPDLQRRVEIYKVFKDGCLGRPRKIDVDSIAIDRIPTLLCPDEMPEKLVLRGPPSRVPGAFTSHNSICIVTQPIREAIEGLEPGVHQFLPIEVFFKTSGKQLKNPCFILNVHQQKSMIVKDQEAVRANPVGEAAAFYTIYWHKKPIWVEKPSEGNPHLWREPGFKEIMVMSDALKSALDARGLKFFKPHKAKFTQS